jgi:signal peptidase I
VWRRIRQHRHNLFVSSLQATSQKTRRKGNRTYGGSATTDKTRKNGSNGQPQPKGKVREWLDAMIFALVVMLIVRTLIFDLFRIPTPSMEKTLLVGDYLFVSKLHYGTRTPMTIGIPFTQIYLKGISLPHTRFPGFTEVQRGDAIVFNYPPEDKPVDRKMHYIKRVVGLPGETLEVRDKVVYANGEQLPFRDTMQQFWNVHLKDARYRLSEARLNELGVIGPEPTQDPNILRIQATREAADEIGTWPWIESVRPFIAPDNAGYGSYMYPSGHNYTPDNYGPVTIPEEGMTVTLSDENWPVYETTITRYEGHTARRLGANQFEIDGEVRNTYTFEQDYYFAMGDNRDNSEDSRFWGFVPFDHVVGKAILIYFSWDTEANLPRFGRMFSLIE